MIANSILFQNLKPFCDFLARQIGYRMTALDWDALLYGVEKYRNDKDQWLEYPFDGDIPLLVKFSFEYQGGTDGLVFIQCEAPPEIECSLNAAIMLMGMYTLVRG